MTAPSINPRRFSRGRHNLDPEHELSVFMSLMIHGNPSSLSDAFRAIDRQKQDWPQARVAPVALTFENGHYILVLEVAMGAARTALQGGSAQVAAGYGFLHAVSRNLYTYRPVLSSPPTEAEREAFRSLTANPRKRQEKN